MNHEITNIVPYNNVYYRSCEFLAYFTAIQSLSGDIDSYLVNDTFIYLPEHFPEHCSVSLKTTSRIPFNELTEANNIFTEIRQIEWQDIVDIVKAAILSENIVIVQADGFYYRHPYHNLFYRIEHHLQPFLIYGFDSDQEVFKIVDVNGFAWDSEKCCYKHEISFKNLAACFKSAVEQSSQDYSQQVQYFRQKNHKKIMKNTSGSYREILIDNMKNSKNAIYDGLEIIKSLINNINSFDINETACFANKVASASNVYKMKRILADDVNIDILKEINNKWIFFEQLVYKNKTKEKKEKKEYSLILQEIYDLELSFYDIFFSQYGG